MPTIELPDDELAAAIVAIGRAIETDRYPRAPRLDPLRAALARFEAAAEPAPHPPAQGDKRAAVTGGAFDDGAGEGGLAGGLPRT